MRRAGLGILGLLVPAALLGCGGRPRQPVSGYAPIVRMADNASWPIETWEKEIAREEPPKKDATPIVLDVLVLAGRPAYLKEHGLPFDLPARVISAEERKGVLAGLGGEPQARQLFLQQKMKILARSGQVCHFVARSGYEYEAEVPSPSAKPGANLMTVSDGVALSVEAAAEGRDIVFTRIEPKVVAFLGLRRCTAQARVGGVEREVAWQEPAVLVSAGRVPTPCRIRVGPGEWLFVPLHHSVLVGQAKSRSLVGSRSLREQYEPGVQPLRRPDSRGYPIRNQAFVLLVPRLGESKAAPADAPKAPMN